jgi:hypothetical protein
VPLSTRAAGERVPVSNGPTRPIRHREQTMTRIPHAFHSFAIAAIGVVLLTAGWLAGLAG